MFAWARSTSWTRKHTNSAELKRCTFSEYDRQSENNSLSPESSLFHHIVLPDWLMSHLQPVESESDLKDWLQLTSTSTADPDSGASHQPDYNYAGLHWLNVPPIAFIPQRKKGKVPIDKVLNVGQAMFFPALRKQPRVILSRDLSPSLLFSPKTTHNICYQITCYSLFTRFVSFQKIRSTFHRGISFFSNS